MFWNDFKHHTKVGEGPNLRFNDSFINPWASKNPDNSTSHISTDYDGSSCLKRLTVLVCLQRLWA